MDGQTTTPITPQEILAARAAIDPVFLDSPVMRHPALDLRRVRKFGGIETAYVDRNGSGRGEKQQRSDHDGSSGLGLTNPGYHARVTLTRLEPRPEEGRTAQPGQFGRCGDAAGEAGPAVGVQGTICSQSGRMKGAGVGLR